MRILVFCSLWFLMWEHIHISRCDDMFWFSLCVSRVSFELVRFYFNQRAICGFTRQPCILQAPATATPLILHGFATMSIVFFHLFSLCRLVSQAFPVPSCKHIFVSKTCAKMKRDNAQKSPMTIHDPYQTKVTAANLAPWFSALSPHIQQRSLFYTML